MYCPCLLNCVLLWLTHVCMNMYHLLPLINIIQLSNVVTRKIGRRVHNKLSDMDMSGGYMFFT